MGLHCLELSERGTWNDRNLGITNITVNLPLFYVTSVPSHYFSQALRISFSHGDYIRISEFQCKIFGLKQDSRTVSEFFTTLKILWEELEAYLPTPVCSYPY